MLTKARLKYFKMFEDQQFELGPGIVLAGPNNSGKTTLIQAISAWRLALDRWLVFRERTQSRARVRTGVQITRRDFAALPLREMNLLWTDTKTAYTKIDRAIDSTRKPGQPKLVQIELEGREPTGDKPWNLVIEFRYRSSEVLYARPRLNAGGTVPDMARNLEVAHIPPFSGIGAEETRFDRGYQDLLIGQGKPGDILRNVLLEVWQRNDGSWERLREGVREMFHCDLLVPKYTPSIPHIILEYLPGIPPARGSGHLPRLDISSAGSGFLQVLIILGLFYARPASVLLVDEPDAHLHINLQGGFLNTLRNVAKEKQCQLIIATHSGVVIRQTNPDRIISLYGKPHRLGGKQDQKDICKSLEVLSALDLFLAESQSAVLYLEDQSDFDLLRQWAHVLKHASEKWLDANIFYPLHGSDIRRAKTHFSALRLANPSVRGLVILDRNSKPSADLDKEVATNLRAVRWRRYEIESYLVHPKALVRFVTERTRQTTILGQKAEEWLRDELPPKTFRRPLADHQYLRAIKASEGILPGFFQAAGKDVSKSDYSEIASQMLPEEIHPEVTEKLDLLARVLGLDERNDPD